MKIVKNILLKPVYFVSSVFRHIYLTIKKSATAKVLLIIILVKFSIFYGFFKQYWFPVHLTPEWESDQHRIEEVTRTIISNHKNNNND